MDIIIGLVVVSLFAFYRAEVGCGENKSNAGIGDDCFPLATVKTMIL